ncbi:MAG: NADAR family protein [Bacteroidales bacterium]
MMKDKKVKKSDVKKTKKKVEADKPREIRYNAKIPQSAFMSQFANIPVALFYFKNEKKIWLEFDTAEAAFQYFKTLAEPFREKIKAASSAANARYWGSAKAQCPIREDWDDIREKVMLRVVWAKYTQNIYYAQKLLATEDAVLVEHAPWDKEGFWGETSPGNGENKAGIITMKVRTRLSKHMFDPSDHYYDMSKYI